MTTPQTQPARRTELVEAIQALRDAGALSLIPGVFERASIRIGRDGWWGGRNKKRPGCQCCIWLAVETEMDASFGDPNTLLRGQAFTVVIGLMIRHFGVRILREVFDLNDKQPEYEGQGWAMYHLGDIAKTFQTEYL